LLTSFRISSFSAGYSPYIAVVIAIPEHALQVEPDL
jgi:hypothetical protein